MAVIQISKIQLRRGFAFALPGQPTTPGDFTTLTPGLDLAELGFATDSGRLFLGTGDATFPGTAERTTYPYQNIEVLTEYAPSIRNLLPETRELAANTLVQTSTGLTLPITTVSATAPTTTGVTITYTLVEIGVGLPAMRRGELRVITNGVIGGGEDTQWFDNAISGLSNPAVTFFASVVSPSTFEIDFTNTGVNPVNFTYRIL